MPFRLLRDSLTDLSLPAEEQRRVLAGYAVTDELADDFDNAVGCIAYETERSGIQLPEPLVAELRLLLRKFDAPPEDALWDEHSLDSHPTWACAREMALRLLPLLP